MPSVRRGGARRSPAAGRAEVLYALDDPLALLVLLLSFLSACTLSGWTSALLAARAGSREVRDERRLRPDPRRHVDPFGAVAAVLSGVGWPRPVAVPFRSSRGQLLQITLAGPVVTLLVGALLLIAVGVLAGPVLGAGTGALQAGVPDVGPGVLPEVLLLAGLVHLFVGLLSLLPIPPLDGGRLLFGLAPRTRGWQQAEGYLVERNLGVVVVLVLLLFPLAGRQPLLLVLLTEIGSPLVGLLTGA